MSNGRLSYSCFKLGACMPSGSEYLSCDALIEFVLRHRLGLRVLLANFRAEHAPTLRTWTSIRRGSSAGSRRWGRFVFL
jgi:hypothetical protein